MEKYIGNKKSIVSDIYAFIDEGQIRNNLLIDVFSGTTNVGQFFKQKGYSIVSNDINALSYVLGVAYIKNNSFPKYTKLLNKINKKRKLQDPETAQKDISWIQKRINGDVVFSDTYFNDINFQENIYPLILVLEYLNNININKLSKTDLLFYDYYSKDGAHSDFISARGTTGKRNYFSSTNAKKLGKIMSTIKKWKNEKLINEKELCILLTSIIEEVSLIANVNGTFHDFNRDKLFPNSLVPLHLKPIAINIYGDRTKTYTVIKGDANKLSKNTKFRKAFKTSSTLYIDPPYNFRQYSSYYHLLNFIASYCKIKNIQNYAKDFQYVRGQNMKDNFDSQYCYKDTFAASLTDLIKTIKSKDVLISYCDVNNHWNKKNKERISEEGREVIINIFKTLNFEHYIKQPYEIERQNYQSQNGEHKENIKELLFYGRR